MMSGADHFGQSKMAMYGFYKSVARSFKSTSTKLGIHLCIRSVFAFCFY